MQTRMVAFKESKDPVITVRMNQSRVLPLRVLQCFMLFLVLGLAISIVSLNTFRYFAIHSLSPVVTRSTILHCFDKPQGIATWVTPPSILLHTMNDTELFWGASFVPQIKEYPFKRVRKIAFMFLAKGPLPLAPLWERFFKGHEGFYSIYVHSLPSYVHNFTASSVFYKRQVPSQNAEWGMMSMCDAERRLLANALLDISNEWFILVSESCIPLQNFSIIYHYISRSHYSFMGAFDEPGPNGRGRYNWQMQPEVTLDQWRKGSQWFEVDRELAVRIIQDTKYYPKFKEFCRPACYVDEHYFTTMLSIEIPHRLANRTLTWVDWSRGGNHPASFGKVDITEGLFKKIFEGQTCLYNNQPSTVCVLFARKFAPSALDPLLGLTSKVFGF
ncbi:glycosyltransferase BC10-like [Tripterygium wilfordii]|uniref:glycosyltransferase BC10-like n=1 Tax=Tripterygium wilfordii TaxID=458696 RepID=UPI0018F8031C|nr:glycosyltransferase BC10-like [Tripterygium wilfordii]